MVWGVECGMVRAEIRWGARGGMVGTGWAVCSDWLHLQGARPNPQPIRFGYRLEMAVIWWYGAVVMWDSVIGLRWLTLIITKIA